MFDDVEKTVRFRYVPQERGEYIPPKLYRRSDDMPTTQNAASTIEESQHQGESRTLRLADVRMALAEKPMTRKQLAEKFGVTGREMAKKVHKLLVSGEADEIDSFVTLVNKEENLQSTSRAKEVDKKKFIHSPISKSSPNPENLKKIRKKTANFSQKIATNRQKMSFVVL